jgi:hypothetical protein
MLSRDSNHSNWFYFVHNEFQINYYMQFVPKTPAKDDGYMKIHDTCRIDTMKHRTARPYELQFKLHFNSFMNVKSE